MTAYDLLVIDLDGTLLAPDGTVSRRNAQAVRAAREAGIEVVIATGRALVESLGALVAIEHEEAVVTAGGSMLNHASSGRTIDRRAMAEDLVREVVDALVLHGQKALLLKDAAVTGYDYLAVGPGALDPVTAWWFRTLPVRVAFAAGPDDDPDPGETVRVGAVAEASALAPIAGWIRAAVGDRAFLQHWGAVTPTDQDGARETHLLEVFDPSVNKWTMVAAHCARCGVDPRRVAAIGDGLNDVELVREAGLGVAMANADPRVRAVATRVTGSCVEDGVADAIARILEGSW